MFGVLVLAFYSLLIFIVSMPNTNCMNTYAMYAIIPIVNKNIQYTNRQFEKYIFKKNFFLHNSLDVVLIRVCMYILRKMFKTSLFVYKCQWKLKNPHKIGMLKMYHIVLLKWTRSFIQWTFKTLLPNNKLLYYCT